MAKLWKKSRETERIPKLDEVVLPDISIRSPTVIFLPGIFTTTKHKQHTAEGMDDVESLLRRHRVSPLPDIYGLTHDNLRNIFNLASYNGNPKKACSRAAREMAEALILPLVLKDGKPLPQEQAAVNLRNLTLVGYSAGTVFAQEMYNASLKKMKQAGYGEDAAKKVLNEVVLVSMATVSRPTKEQDRFTTVYLAGTNDLAVRVKNRIWRPLSRIFSRHSRDLVIRQLSRTSLLITAAIPRKFWNWRDEEDGSRVKASIAPLLPEKSRVRTNHEMPHYMTCDDEHNAFSKIVLYTLVNAIGRKTLLTPAELIQPDKAQDMEKAKSYRDRIDAGIHRADDRNKHKKGGTDVKKDPAAARIHAPSPYPGICPGPGLQGC